MKKLWFIVVALGIVYLIVWSVVTSHHTVPTPADLPIGASAPSTNDITGQVRP